MKPQPQNNANQNQPGSSEQQKAQSSSDSSQASGTSAQKQESNSNPNQNSGGPEQQQQKVQSSTDSNQQGNAQNAGPQEEESSIFGKNPNGQVQSCNQVRRGVRQAGCTDSDPDDGTDSSSTDPQGPPEQQHGSDIWDEIAGQDAANGGGGGLGTGITPESPLGGPTDTNGAASLMGSGGGDVPNLPGLSQGTTAQSPDLGGNSGSNPLTTDSTPIGPTPETGGAPTLQVGGTLEGPQLLGPSPNPLESPGTTTGTGTAGADVGGSTTDSGASITDQLAVGAEGGSTTANEALGSLEQQSGAIDNSITKSEPGKGVGGDGGPEGSEGGGEDGGDTGFGGEGVVIDA